MGLLAAADANFAALGQQVSDWWSRLLNNVRFIDQLMYILLSLPVGAWLYGLVGGSCAAKPRPPRRSSVPLCWKTAALCRAPRRWRL